MLGRGAPLQLPLQAAGAPLVTPSPSSDGRRLLQVCSLLSRCLAAPLFTRIEGLGEEGALLDPRIGLREPGARLERARRSCGELGLLLPPPAAPAPAAPQALALAPQLPWRQPVGWLWTPLLPGLLAPLLSCAIAGFTCTVAGGMAGLWKGGFVTA